MDWFFFAYLAWSSDEMVVWNFSTRFPDLQKLYKNLGLVLFWRLSSAFLRYCYCGMLFTSLWSKDISSLSGYDDQRLVWSSSWSMLVPSLDQRLRLAFPGPLRVSSKATFLFTSNTFMRSGFCDAHSAISLLCETWLWLEWSLKRVRMPPALTTFLIHAQNPRCCKKFRCKKLSWVSCSAQIVASTSPSDP